ncbi:hypothetical protein ACYOEI_00260 [Singulisphaera rosea]
MTRRPWWDTPPPPQKVFKKSRAIPKDRPATQESAEIANTLRSSPSPSVVHPYDTARLTMNALELADHILQEEKRLVLHCGAYFLDGKYELPSKRIHEADIVLKRLGLRPIPMRRR